MKEIKLRDKVIENILGCKNSTGRRMTNIEFVCLQFRKICEIIILSALCAHKRDFIKVRSNIKKVSEPNKIRKILEKIHPEFYPIPFERIIDKSTGKPKNELITNGYLTKDECIDLIGRCGGVLHGFNPYNDTEVFKEVDAVENQFSEWQMKVRRLLKTHEIKLLGMSKQLWVYMAKGPNQKVSVEERVPL
ncbi:MAG: hypothetical protein EHM20_02590 [Alphaproteobacteria bacterium]|nr:MAG: hypothetical protein EHM20_02590 [Alphaproteobacteria bacterium]